MPFYLETDQGLERVDGARTITNPSWGKVAEVYPVEPHLFIRLESNAIAITDERVLYPNFYVDDDDFFQKINFVTEKTVVFRRSSDRAFLEKVIFKENSKLIAKLNSLIFNRFSASSRWCP